MRNLRKWSLGLTALIFATTTLLFNNCSKSELSSEITTPSASAAQLSASDFEAHDSDFALIGPDDTIINSKSDLEEGSAAVSKKIYWNGSGNATAAPRWKNGLVNWYYNPSGQPTTYSTDQAVATIQKSITAWQSVCGIKFVYQGITTRSTDSYRDGYVTLGWGDANGYSGGYTTVQWDGSKNFTDSDIEFSSSGIRNDLFGIANHELGHLLGLDHSDVSESIMFANPYHTADYMQTLRNDDINGCVGLYGQSFVAATPTPTVTPSPTPTPKATVTPSPTPSPTPRATVTPKSTPKPSPSPTPYRKWRWFWGR